MVIIFIKIVFILLCYYYFCFTARTNPDRITSRAGLCAKFYTLENALFDDTRFALKHATAVHTSRRKIMKSIRESIYIFVPGAGRECNTRRIIENSERGHTTDACSELVIRGIFFSLFSEIRPPKLSRQ